MIDLGDKVTAITQELKEVEGVVVAFVINNSGRKTATLRCEKEGGADIAEADISTLNCTPEFKEQYTELKTKANDIAEKSNKKIGAISKKANKEMEELTNALLGKPYDI